MAGRERPSPDLRSTSTIGVGGVVSGKVEVVYALPERQHLVELDLTPDGLTARQAVERSGLLQALPELDTQTLVLGVFGEICEDSRPLRAGDRVEIYRPLKHDPRTMRRERAAATARKVRRR